MINYKVLIEPIKNLRFYQSYLTFDHRFETSGQYEINLKIKNETKIISKQISIVDIKYSDYKCENSVYDNRLDCHVLLISQTKNEIFNFKFGKCASYDLTNNGELMNGFGFLKSSKSEAYYPNGSSLLLVNSEFKFQANLVGFEFEVYNSGTLIVCLYILDQNETLSLREENRLGIWYLEASFGLNKIILDKPLKAPKGSMIFIDSESTSKIIIDDSSDGYRSDLIISAGHFTRPNQYKNAYFSFKCLTDVSFYLSNLKIAKFFQQPGSYELQLDSNIQKFAVNNHKNLEIKCDANDSVARCSLLIVSQAEFDSVFVDYGDCEFDIFNSSKFESINYFGPTLNISSSYQQDSDHYLLTNNEFKYTSFLIGFKIFVIDPGSIDLLFVSFGECGSLKPCSLYEENINFDSLNFSQVKFSLNLKKGWNEFFVDRPEKIQKGSFLLMTNKTAQIGITESFSSDFIFKGKIFTKMQNNKAFLIFSLIETNHYLDFLTFNKTYSIQNDYQIGIKLANSSINILIDIEFKKDFNNIGINYENKINDIYEELNDCKIRRINMFFENFSTDCTQDIIPEPEIDMTDIKNITHPKKFFRSDIIIIHTDFKFNVDRDFTIRKKWTIFPIFPNKTIKNKSFDLLNNPTVNTYNLVIKSNTLDYGLYLFKLHVELEVNLVNKMTRFEKSIETHVQVLPGGIALFSLENGLEFVRIGTEQGLTFNTIKYAYDMDFIIKIHDLEYVNFYCFKMDIKHLNDQFSITDKRFDQNLNHVVASIFMAVNLDLCSLLMCRISGFCKRFNKYFRINAANQLVIESKCVNGCQNAKKIDYRYRIFYKLDSQWKNMDNISISKYTKGYETTELTLFDTLFDSFEHIDFWRINFDITIFNEYNQTVTGSTVINLRVNHKPFNGKCQIDCRNGTAYYTVFKIECLDWLDSDGYITRYEYFVKLGNDSRIINYNDNGVLITTLPPGLINDSYNLNILIQIIDDSGAITIFEIPDCVTVVEDSEILRNITLQMADNLTRNKTIVQFKTLSIPEASQKIIIFSSAIKNLDITINRSDLELIKTNLIQILINLDINDLSDIKIITMVYGLITENNAYASYSIELIQKLKYLSISLYNYSETSNLNYLKQASDKIIESIGNLFRHCHSKKCFQLFNSMLKILNDLLKTISKHLSISQRTEVLTSNMHYKSLRLLSAELDQQEIFLSDGQLKLTNNHNNQLTTILQSFSIPNILNGINGEQLNLDNSSLVSLSYHSDTSEEIKINNADFRIKIKRNVKNEPEFIQYNISNDTDPTIKVIIYKINLQNSNSSIIFQIKPENKSQSFLVMVKFNQNPSLTFRLYDMMFSLCSDMLINDTFYQIFINSSTVKSYLVNDHVGFSISLIDDPELFDTYCVKKFTNFPDILKVNIFNLSIFSVRIYSLGCYYLEQSGEWSSNGMDVAGPNFEYTDCYSSHLTVFAGGFIVLPSEIDFESVFANSSFEKNITIYITVIVLAVLYIIAAIICIYVDRKDSDEVVVNYVGDSSKNPEYFYEVLIFTGCRKNAGTDSKVFINLYGQNGESQMKKLEGRHSNRKTFKRGGVDCFLLGLENNLGALELCRIYQDNSGRTDAASSWYLKYVIVSDLKTNEKYHFICEKWLDISNGQIDQRIPVSGEEKLKNLAYLLKRQTKDKISDEHLWFSLITKPRLSNFSRIDRLTCCFVLLFTTMLTNILYYEVDKSTKSGGIELGPFRLTAEQIGIGIISNLMIIPPSYIIIQLFRRSRRRGNKSTKADYLSKMKIHDNQKKTESFKFLKTTFPWWTKIIAYLLSLAICIVSIFFIVVKGISFGNEKVTKWLTSFVVSILTSFFLTQPFQVALITTFVVFIVRKIDNLTNFVYIVPEIDSSESPTHEFTNLEDELRIIKYEMESVYTINREKLKKKIIYHRKAKLAIREVISYFIFILILYLMIYENKNKNSFNYQNHLSNVFGIKRDNFSKIERVSSFWDWMRTDFLKSFDQNESNILNDKVSLLIGYPLLRQLRVESRPCKFLIEKRECFSDFGLLNREKRDFAPRWIHLSKSIVLYNLSNSDVFDSFKYTHSRELEAYPIVGINSVYFGGGYVYKMNLNKKNFTILSKDLNQLEKLKWIDKKTRAVVLEFSLYNPNLNLFSYNTILFEFLLTGNLVKSVRFEPIIVFKEQSLQILINVICFLYFCFIIFFMVKEVLLIVKQKLNYLKKFWIYAEWSIFVFSWTVFFIYVYRLYATGKFLNSRKEFNMSDQLIKLQALSYWNNVLEMCLGILSFLGTMKFLKVLRYNRNIKYFSITMRISMKKLFFFTLIFLIYWTAFVQMFYLILMDKSKYFSSIISSYETTFLMMLNKLPNDVIKGNVNFLGNLLIIIFYGFVVLVLLNIIISIIIDSFSMVRLIGAMDGEEDSYLLVYIKDKIEDFILMLR
ncbi:polycystic kidney disease 1-like 2 [Brachionus plicatilis]|uniref:Polycystic kidney disease 1-like 2 n=1 Tax=Brachionus plicatilis TaxID=10195 RepID=A0A3M7Q3M5_BRAPC|nr:polycystic kidney disease 1-like 2 [Brachionus plicatilis]